MSCPHVLLSFADFQSGPRDPSRKTGHASLRSDGQKIEAPQTMLVGLELICSLQACRYILPVRTQAAI